MSRLPIPKSAVACQETCDINHLTSLHSRDSFLIGLGSISRESLSHPAATEMASSSTYPQNTRPKSNVALLQDLSTAVNGQAASATFACGGSVPIVDPASTNDDTTSSPVRTCAPVTLRWDTNAAGEESKISFPLPAEQKVSGSMLSALMKACQPATFGFGGRDVLDESYRKATKLDAAAFSTNFHPHDCGILGSVQQILLPSMGAGDQRVGVGPQGARAELYNLNIYAGPSGKFHAHVDTPRGAMQFGSLVVCLPCEHKGGSLRVKHRGKMVEFAWAEADLNCIHWAAFYGDCEHEVLEVASGHRITLTYNLYYSSIGPLAQPIADPRHLPLYRIATDTLREASFMPNGGVLGFFCHHQYAHAQGDNRKPIPGAFKGVDLAVYSVFDTFGLKIGIHPIVSNEEREEDGEKSGELWRMGGISCQELMWTDLSDDRGDPIELFLDNLKQDAHMRKKAEEEEDYNGMCRIFEEHPDPTTIVGESFHDLVFDGYPDQDTRKPISDKWKHEKVHGILWMNKPVHSEYACVGLIYGNNASLTYQFSYAAILVDVPPVGARSQMFAKLDRESKERGDATY